jgi:peptide/nickel transport system permease protein
VTATLNARYLKDPFLTRYLWLKDVVRGDLGPRSRFRECDDAHTPACRRYSGTVLYASLIIVIGGIGLGLIGALRQARWTEVIGITTLSAAMPSFVAAVILLLVFSVELGWFPARHRERFRRHDPPPDVAGCGAGATSSHSSPA